MPRIRWNEASSHHTGHAPQSIHSPPETQTIDQLLIAIDRFALEVIEQPPPLTDHHQQATAGMKIFLMDLEVLSQVANSFA